MVQPVKPSTIAKSLAIGNPADGPYVLDVVRRTGGAVVDVDDDAVVSAMLRTARFSGAESCSLSVDRCGRFGE